MGSTTVFAATNADITESNAEYEDVDKETSITYDMSTHEITYGEDQIYPASQVDAIEDDEIGSRGVIGNDDRVMVNNTEDSPYINVCLIEAYFSNGMVRRSTGTLVYFNVVLACAHGIYEPKYGGYPERIEVTPARNGNKFPRETSYATRITSTKAWTEDNNPEWDWAIIDLDRKYSTWQYFSYYKTPEKGLYKTITAIGYPKDKGGTTMYRAEGQITNCKDRRFNFSADTYEGQSGGPVIDKNSGYLVGIITQSAYNANNECTYNAAVRINEDLCNRLLAHQQEMQ